MLIIRTVSRELGSCPTTHDPAVVPAVLLKANEQTLYFAKYCAPIHEPPWLRPAGLAPLSEPFIESCVTSRFDINASIQPQNHCLLAEFPWRADLCDSSNCKSDSVWSVLLNLW